MRRPTERQLRTNDFLGVGGMIVDILAALGISLEELPDIIPEHPEESGELRDQLAELFRAKGLPVDEDWVT